MTVHNHGTEEGEGLACPEIRLPGGGIAGKCITNEKGRLVAYTKHGHYIPGTFPGELEQEPSARARCGGPAVCKNCQQDAELAMKWEHRVGEPTSYPDIAKKLVTNYIDKRAYHAGKPIEVYEVYVVWFTKTLQNWKALVSTTMADGMYYEVTYNGDKFETYLDIYAKVENVVIPD